MNASREPARPAYHLVIPAKAGTQAVPMPATGRGAGMPACHRGRRVRT